MNEIKYQEDGANYIFDQMYKKGKNYFLLADEVGLGKTITAARLIEKIFSQQKRKNHPLKIGYICGNIALANENVKKLKQKIKSLNKNIKVESSKSSRLSLSFKNNFSNTQNDIEIYVVTPSTTLKMNTNGTMEERAYGYRLINYNNKLNVDKLNVENDLLYQQCAVGCNFEKEVKKAVKYKNKNFADNFNKCFTDEWNKIKGEVYEKFIKESMKCFTINLSYLAEFFAYKYIQKMLKDGIKVGQWKKPNGDKITKKIEEIQEKVNKEFVFDAEEYEKVKEAFEKFKGTQAVDFAETIKEMLLEEYKKPYLIAFLVDIKNNSDSISRKIIDEIIKMIIFMTIIKDKNIVSRVTIHNIFRIITKETNNIFLTVSLKKYYGYFQYKVKKNDDERIEKIKEKIKEKFKKICCGEYIKTARKCMIVASVNSLNMDLFIADEIQNYSEIFNKDYVENNTEMDFVVTNLLHRKNKVLMMSATPFRYHTKSCELDNKYKDDNADSENNNSNLPDDDKQNNYLSNESDIYTEFKKIIKYLCEGNDFDSWIKKWEELNVEKNTAIKEENKENYKTAVKEQSEMLQNVGISRVERYKSGYEITFESENKKLDFDELSIMDLKNMPQISVSEISKDELEDGDILFSYDKNWYIRRKVDGNETYYSFSDYRDDDYKSMYKVEIEEEVLYSLLKSSNAEVTSSALRKGLKSRLNVLQREYIKSTPAYFSFGQDYVKVEDKSDKSGKYILRKDKIQNFKKIFADTNDIKNKNTDLLFNARFAKLCKVLFDDEQIHKLLFIPPSREVQLTGVFEGKRGISKRLFFSDYNMTTRSLSALLSYEANRRTIVDLDDLKEKFKNKDKAEIPVFKNSDEKIDIDALCSFENCNENNDAIKKLKDKLLGDENKENYLQECFSENEINYDEKKILINYFTSIDSLRVIIAYSEGDNVDNVFDMIQNYCRAGCLKEVLSEYFEVVNYSVDSRGSVSRIPKFNFGSVQAEVENKDKAEIPVFKNSDEKIDIDALCSFENCNENNDAIKKLKDKLLGDENKENYLQECFSENEINYDEKKILINYFTSIDSLRVIIAYSEGDNVDNVFDMIQNYCRAGCLKEVLSEYFEVVNYSVDSRGSVSRIPKFNFGSVQAEVENKENIIPKFNFGSVQAEVKNKENIKMPVSFAIGNSSVTDEENAATFNNKIAMFNSPFRPMQFITTSIGQEGFDFHYYCRKIVHWSLEFNPVKFEQREGRINRYHSYCNRLNTFDICKKYSNFSFTSWEKLYEFAREKLKTVYDASKGLVPDFVCKNTEKFPMVRECYYYHGSFEAKEFENVLKAVGYYRALLGQSATENLEDALENFIEKDKKSEYFVDLYPPKV